MKLVLREYLGMLRESGEFDQVVPDLLLAMNIVPISKAQVGVRQAGVDVAAVGSDGQQPTLWLFVLKRGDLGRREWDSQPQSVRQSLDEIKDVYLRNHVAPEHAQLPVKIVVATTGDFKQEFEQNRVGYADANTQPGRTYHFWNGDHLAALIETHLLNEYALPAAARSQLRRALALTGEPDYDLRHFHEFLRMTLQDWGTADSSDDAKNEKECVRALVTARLGLTILCRWSGQDGNLRNALLACERTLLWAWDAIRRRGFTESKSILASYIRIFGAYLATSIEYLNKVHGHFAVDDALCRYYREAALLTERVFEEIGIVATIGLCHLLWGDAIKDEKRIDGARGIAEVLHGLIETHPCSGSPCYDEQVIDACLALMLLTSTKEDFARSWLRELSRRLDFGYKSGRWFPIASDSFDDLVALEVHRHDVDQEKLKEMSWMLPTLAQWAAALDEDEVYTALVDLCTRTLKTTCLQLWYPDSHTDELLYSGPAHWDGGVTQAPIELPQTAEEMRTEMRKLRSESPVKEVMSSARRSGISWLEMLASRHFRTPVDPMWWQRLLERKPEPSLADARQDTGPAH